MATPVVNLLTEDQIRARLREVEDSLDTPIPVLRRLKSADALTIEEFDLLEEYDSLLYLLGEDEQ